MCCQSLPFTSMQILVVDSDPDSQYLLKLIFEEYGIKTIGVTSALEALEILQQIKPDLLISEINLPREDGYSLMCKVKALEKQKIHQIPAIALTTDRKEDARAHAISVGFGKYLSKPFDIDELLATVACLIDNFQWVPIR